MGNTEKASEDDLVLILRAQDKLAESVEKTLRAQDKLAELMKEVSRLLAAYQGGQDRDARGISNEEGSSKQLCRERE